MKKLLTAILILVFTMLCFAGCSKNNDTEIKTANISMTVEQTEAKNYAKMKKVAEKRYECTSFIRVSENEHGVYFDTHSGVVYYRDENIGTNYVVLYQTDGLTPRNIYHQNGVYSEEAIVKWLLENYWDQL